MRLLLFLYFLFFVDCAWSQSEASHHEDYFVTRDGVKLYYEITGEGDPVLLVHGFVVNSQSWKKSAVYKDLITEGHKVIILDLRGNGKSDKPQRQTSYTNDAEAKDIMQLMDKLKMDAYKVVGYSRGSIIASRLLVLDKRVSRVVLGGMGADFTNPEWPRRILFYRALMGEPVEELKGFIDYVKTSGLDQKALAYMQYGQPSTSAAELLEVKKPVLVICGTADEDNGSSKTLASMIPSSTYLRVPGDHNNTVNTEAFSQAVIQFLK